MAVINTGIVERTIVGVNESDLFLDSESTSVATNTGIVERSIVGVHDANFVHPLGDELVTNGDFATDSDWTKGTGWSISDGSANCDGTQTSPTNLIQNNLSLGTGKILKITFQLKDHQAGSLIYVNLTGTGTLDFENIDANGTYVAYSGLSTGDNFITFRADADFIGSIDNISVKEMLVNRESTATNTGIIERAITGLNESELWLDAESTSVVNNTGIVERPITGVNESDALFPDNTESTVVNISDTIIPSLAGLEARATTFENREGTQNILINLQKC